MSRFPIDVTGVVVAVPGADRIVGDVRRRYVADSEGLPAHVTVLFPWLPLDSLDSQQLDRLAMVAAALEPFEAQLCGVGRFPATVWLKPTPAERFVAMTNAIWREWPDYPPFQGQFDEVVPHLTVADGQAEAVLDEVQGTLASMPPLTFQVTELALLTFDGLVWRHLEAFRLGA